MSGVVVEDALVAALADVLEADAVIYEAGALDYYANDVYRSGGLPRAVVRPKNVEALQRAVRICAEAGVAMVPRGGGASYTDGYILPAGGHVVFDTGALDTIEINEQATVVTVGAGVTWANLKAALDAKGLRTPFWGPFSGIAATVGGSMSQNTLSHGSTMHGISAQSVLSMDVVLASGEVLSTSASDAMRFYGPDLTGLFTGDCGVFGIKARITLPLLPVLPYFECLSFAFDSFADYHAASRKAAMARLDDSHFGLDLALSQGQIGRQDGMGARLKIALDVLKRAPNKVKGITQLLRMAIAGEDAMRAGAYMCHFIIEGFDAEEAAIKAKLLRRQLDGLGREIANSIPTFVQSVPFAPLFNVLGPGGERWVPIHGVFAHDRAVAFDAAFKAMIAARKAEMDALGVWLGTMFSPVGPTGFLYEIALYWPDDRTSYHRQTLGDEYLAKQPSFAPNDASRAYADDLKTAIVALMQDYGAGHFQLGRAYPYQPRLAPPAAALVRAIKSQLDPKGLMNPGALGF
ncbi:FAD binding domain protein [Novosphingobium sp. Rr 2-17]|uniref:FAD-binding oxidoreductase n=1 Tax=Novosphingobium sp. Rr 2-17 TaxID=555793 RepID=UPI000269882B|nr:FAD-binding oxidoreductase [Novosphingobium sp. Rr 2-17]EIZ80533.1 FAD binding domain protein [Novosphingobium sp. Rr 2-17]